MAEKLYKANCRFHGTRCEVAQDKIPDKKTLSKTRRRAGKKFIARELSMIKYDRLIDNKSWN